MLKSIKTVILVLTLGVLASLLPMTAHAQSLDYSALKYGTNQTSMASGYFVHPAKVTVQHHAYVVTMDIKTAKKLTSWPVTVLSVDGHAPENVRKTKDSAGNSHLYYAFTTTNLKRKVNAKLAIDVPDVYKAKHLITFKFKTNQLPALTSIKPATSAAKTTKTTSATTSSHHQPATTQSSHASSAAKPATKTPKRQHSRQTSQSSATSSQSSQSSATSSQSQQQSTAEADQVPQQKTHWGGLIGGAVAIIVLVGGGSWWYFGRH